MLGFRASAIRTELVLVISTHFGGGVFAMISSDALCVDSQSTTKVPIGLVPRVSVVRNGI